MVSTRSYTCHSLCVSKSCLRPYSTKADLASSLEPLSQPPPSPSTFHSVTVDAKNLLKFLASYSIASTTIACASVSQLLRSALGKLILLSPSPHSPRSFPSQRLRGTLGVCADHCAIFYVYIGDAKDNLQGGVLTFFVPAVSRDGDDD
jgi:HUS1 checkpoint protein